LHPDRTLGTTRDQLEGLSEAESPSRSNDWLEEIRISIPYKLICLYSSRSQADELEEISLDSFKLTFGKTKKLYSPR
jgi:hypothetical protein